jgi:hypothetical protein
MSGLGLPSVCYWVALPSQKGQDRKRRAIRQQSGQELPVTAIHQFPTEQTLEWRLPQSINSGSRRGSLAQANLNGGSDQVLHQ